MSIQHGVPGSYSLRSPISTPRSAATFRGRSAAYVRAVRPPPAPRARHRHATRAPPVVSRVDTGGRRPPAWAPARAGPDRAHTHGGRHMAIDDPGWTDTSGRGAFVRAEPELAGLWQQLEAGFWHATRPDLADLVRRATTGVTGLAPLPVPASVVDRRPVEAWRSSSAFTDEERTVLEFAEQFAADVAGISDAERAALTAALGDDTFGFVQVLYVADFAPRVRAALDALFGPSEPAGRPDLGRGADRRPVAVARALHHDRGPARRHRRRDPRARAAAGRPPAPVPPLPVAAQPLGHRRRRRRLAVRRRRPPGGLGALRAPAGRARPSSTP